MHVIGINHMNKLSLLILSITLPACAGSFEEVKSPSFQTPSINCQKLDKSHRRWSGIAAFSGAAMSSTAIATIPADDDKWRKGLAITTLVGAGISSMSIIMANESSTSWVRDCSNPSIEKVQDSGTK